MTKPDSPLKPAHDDKPVGAPDLGQPVDPAPVQQPLPQDHLDDTAPQYDERPQPPETGPVERSNLPQPTDGALMSLFDYSPQDLEANKQGMVTHLQKQRLQGDLKNDADATWLMLMIMLGVTLLIALITAGGSNMGGLLVGAGIIILPLLYLGYRRQTRIRDDIETTRVKRVRGALLPQPGGMFSEDRHKVRVDDVTFGVSYQQLSDLMQYATTYVDVYYTENSRAILSMEVVPGGEKPKNDKLKNEELRLPDVIGHDDADTRTASQPDSQSRRQMQ